MDIGKEERTIEVPAPAKAIPDQAPKEEPKKAPMTVPRREPKRTPSRKPVPVKK